MNNSSQTFIGKLDTGFKMGMFWFVFNTIMLLFVLITTQTLKRITRRNRPKHISDLRKINLTDIEKGTLSMPSGDTAQAALWCGLMHLYF